MLRSPMKSFAAWISLVFALGCFAAAAAGGLSNPSLELDAIAGGAFLVSGFFLLARPPRDEIED